MTTVENIKASLDQGNAFAALHQALHAARLASAQAIRDNSSLSPVDQFALALQAADEVIEGLALELTAEVPQPKAAHKPKTSRSKTS